MNLAAILGGVHSTNIAEIFAANVCGNLNLIEQCAVHGVQRYVFASSLTVHGKNAPEEPCRLGSPFNPLHAYGASKAAAEYSLMQYTATRGMSVVTLRPSLILGDGAVRHAPIEFLQTLLAGRQIELFGAGTHEREWVWVDDAVAGFVRAVDFCAQAAAGYYPFFLGGNRIAMRDLAFKCAAHLGRGADSVTHIERREQAFTLTCDLADSERVLNWTPHWDLDQMIPRLIQILSTRSAPR